MLPTPYLSCLSVLQRVARHLNPGHAERIYQASYFALADRTDWVKRLAFARPAGRTASFSLLFLLLQILSRGRPQSILEVGMGQSTVLLSQYVEQFGARATCIDHEAFWASQAVSGSPNLQVRTARLAATSAGGRPISWYDLARPAETYELLLVDGPPAYERGTRFNRLGILNWLPDIVAPEFCLVVDDAERKGERLLVERIMALFKDRARLHHIVGGTVQAVIATDAYAEFGFL